MAGDAARCLEQELRPTRPATRRHNQREKIDRRRARTKAGCSARHPRSRGACHSARPSNQEKAKGKSMSKMSLKTEGDVTIVVTRRFNAPPEAVYRAHTEPALVQTWMLGPEGWTMPVCQIDLRAGGKIRYEWSNGNGRGFYLTGELVELTPFSRIVHIERMHLPEPTPDNRVVTTFEPDGSG